jgi:hypothetical protein
VCPDAQALRLIIYEKVTPRAIVFRLGTVDFMLRQPVFGADNALARHSTL